MMIFKFIALSVFAIGLLLFNYECHTTIHLLVLRKRMKKLGYKINWKCFGFVRLLDKNSKYLACLWPNQFDETWVIQITDLDLSPHYHFDTQASTCSDVLELVIELETCTDLDRFVPMEVRFPQMTDELRDKICSCKHEPHFLRK